MELLALWILATLNIALLWYIHTQDENNYFREQNAKEEREKLYDTLRQLQGQATVERKDLYDRLQAGTLPQYKEHADAPNEGSTTEAADELTDLDEAKEEIMGVGTGVASE